MIEPDVSFDALNDDKMSLRSIAISLKRIADHLDKPTFSQLGDALDLSINPKQPEAHDYDEDATYYYDTAKGCMRKVE